MLLLASQAHGLKVDVLAAKLVELAKHGMQITGDGHRKT